MDKTGASVLEAIPSPGTINVPSSDFIEVSFSEDVDKRSFEAAVFVSPRQIGDFKYKWSGKTARVFFPDSFKTNTTYIVNIGASVTDMRKNKMDASFQYAFSTGPSISRGVIQGNVQDNGQPAQGITLGLFTGIDESRLPSFDSLHPEYITQSGKNGDFEFNYLPEGQYFLLAFNDVNRNHMFELSRESFGIADRSINLATDSAINGINIPLIKQDTTTYAILSCTPTIDGLIRIKLSNALVPSALEDKLSHVHLMNISNSSDTGISPVALKEQDKSPITNFSFYFDEGLSPGNYKLRIDNDAFNIANDSISYIESAEFEIGDKADIQAPVVISFSHGNRDVFVSENTFDLYFSEPIQWSDSIVFPFILLDNDAIDYELTMQQVNPMLYRFKASEIVAGKKYTLSINGRVISDLSGNMLSDSIMDYGFATYDTDSLGFVTGSIIFDSSNTQPGSVYLQFSKYPKLETIEYSPDSMQIFYQLPPGKYRLSGYIDRNKNGRRDLGSIYPYEKSETWVVYPDTIRIRPRFETAGINLLFE